ncbi:MAG: agmatine deiminase family protein, partial [Pseudomonadota bacterium]
MELSITIPAEWALHKAIWTCWPSAADLWQEDLEPARAEVAAMINALIAPHNGKFDHVKLLVSGKEAKQSAARVFGDKVELFEIPFGDVWLRDTGPIFANNESGESKAICFGFNGWGGKFVLEHDDALSTKLAACAKVSTQIVDFVLEGGSIDGNGEGVFLTTKQCLLNPTRNPSVTAENIEEVLRANLGAKKIL